MTRTARTLGPSALTVNAKSALRFATLRDDDYWITATEQVAGELIGHGLAHRFDERCCVLRPAGVSARARLMHRDALDYLAKLARQEYITGEDLADIAASIDAGEEDYTGRGEDGFWSVFAKVAEDADMSAAVLREELEGFLGW